MASRKKPYQPDAETVESERAKNLVESGLYKTEEQAREAIRTKDRILQSAKDTPVRGIELTPPEALENLPEGRPIPTPPDIPSRSVPSPNIGDLSPEELFKAQGDVGIAAKGSGKASSASIPPEVSVDSSNKEPTGSPTPEPGPTPRQHHEPGEHADIFGSLGAQAGYLFGGQAGPLGAAVGQVAGGLGGKLLGGGEITGRDVGKAAAGLTSGLLGGAAGKFVGTAAGLFSDQPQPQQGGGGGTSGITVAAGAGGDSAGGPLEEITRLLREMTLNIKSIVADGINIRADHRITGQSQI
jgi:hypothetical protein